MSALNTTPIKMRLLAMLTKGHCTAEDLHAQGDKLMVALGLPDDPDIVFTNHAPLDIQNLLAECERLETGLIEYKKAHKKLQQFKEFVHAKLTEYGIPEDPYPAATIEHGCRISGRLAWFKAQWDDAQDMKQ